MAPPRKGYSNARTLRLPPRLNRLVKRAAGQAEVCEQDFIVQALCACVGVSLTEAFRPLDEGDLSIDAP